jgi:hypothetical protein
MIPAIVGITTPLRHTPGWEEVTPAEYPVQSFSATLSWGSEPAQFNLVYPGTNPVGLGAAVSVSVGAYYIAGVCESCVQLTSSQGNNWQLTCKDYRKWLAWDKAYCSFNKISDTLVGGLRKRRYWHVLPWNFSTMAQTWTDAPYSAAQIIQYVLTGPGIETPWTVGYINTSGSLIQNSYHPNQLLPIYEVDCLSGEPVSALLTRICEQLGLLFTLRSTALLPFNIVFSQKGLDGADVTIPTASDNRESGTELSGNPTRVRVIGDRNLYQVHDIPLVYDWNANWNDFYDVEIFVDYIFKNYITWNPGTDPEQIIARQQARALALEITVREFDTLIGGGGAWLDWRKYGGKCRNELPAALYIQQILFRCFRLPNGFSFKNTYGATLTVNCLEVQDRLIAAVTHDPITGATTADTTDPTSGNAYVICQGYQVGKDMFESIRPERFNLAEWTSSQDVWQKIEVRVEDPGDATGPVIIFDEPVIRSEDLVTMVDGYAVFAANPTITVPLVRATLCFAGERFSWFQTAIGDPSNPPSDPVMGTQTHDEVLNVGGLNGEFIKIPDLIAPYWDTNIYEFYYADGMSCRGKAINYANNFLKFQWTYTRGQFTTPIVADYAYALHGKIDRIVLEYSPNGGTVTVGLTNEVNRINYTPERDLERMNQLRTVLPAQQELKRQSDFAKKIASALRSSKEAYKMLSDAFNGNFVEQQLAKPTVVQPPTPDPLDGTIPLIPIGCVYVKQPNALSGGAITQTRPIDQGSTLTTAYSEFAGVTVKQAHEIDGTKGAQIPLQRTGLALCRVRGPVTAGDTVGIKTTVMDPANRAGALASSPDHAVGRALQSIATATVQLCRVELGVGGSGGSGGLYRLKSVEADYLICWKSNGTTDTEGDVKIAKAFELRESLTFDALYDIADPDVQQWYCGLTYANSDFEGNRIQYADDTGGLGTAETRYVQPIWQPDVTLIVALPIDYSGVTVDGADLKLIDANVAGRVWAKEFAPPA